MTEDAVYLEPEGKTLKGRALFMKADRLLSRSG